MSRLSRYVVATEKFDDPFTDEAVRVLFSTRTGHLVPLRGREADWERSGSLETLSTPTRATLESAGMIVEDESDELAEVVAENRSAAASYDVLYQVVQPTAACQLGCGYCGQQHSARQLSSADQDFFVARVREKLERRPYRALEVGWFGGEPLLGLKVMRTLSPQLYHLAVGAGAEYFARIVTNGVRLTDDVATELSRDHHVRYVEVTLDGGREFHDRRRHWKRTEAGSFDAIWGNLLRLAERTDINFRVGVRCNVDRQNADGVTPLLELLADSGLSSYIEKFYVAPVHPWGNDVSNVALSMEEFAARQIEWFLVMKQLRVPFGLLPPRKRVLCMTVKPESELIDASGALYNCTEVSYVPSYESTGVLGQAFPSLAQALAQIPRTDSTDNVFSFGTVRDGVRSEGTRRLLPTFYDRVEAGQYWCGACEMLPSCGGMCPKSWLEGHPPCPPEKYNIRHRIQLAYLLSKYDVAEVTSTQSPSSATSAKRVELPVMPA